MISLPTGYAQTSPGLLSFVVFSSCFCGEVMGWTFPCKRLPLAIPPRPLGTRCTIIIYTLELYRNSVLAVFSLPSVEWQVSHSTQPLRKKWLVNSRGRLSSGFADDCSVLAYASFDSQSQLSSSARRLPLSLCGCFLSSMLVGIFPLLTVVCQVAGPIIASKFGLPTVLQVWKA